jgi:putative phage-type endonuclease
MITAEQREARRSHIGSSDAPAIVGVDPWKTIGDVYWNKISDLPDTQNEAMKLGNRMEPVILDFAQERYGILRRDVEVVSAYHEELAANLDARIVGTDEGIEAKYVGPRSVDKWGEPETDEIPEHVTIQCQHQMYVAGLSQVHVAAGMCDPHRGLHFEMFHVARDEDLIEDLVTAELRFWQSHVIPRLPPSSAPPSFEILKRIRREPETVVNLAESAVQAWLAREDAAAVKKMAETEYDQATKSVLELLGDCEAGRLPDGRLIVYAQENAGPRLINAKEAQADFPELFTTTYRRVLRLKKAPKA